MQGDELERRDVDQDRLPGRRNRSGAGTFVKAGLRGRRRGDLVRSIVRRTRQSEERDTGTSQPSYQQRSE